MNSWRRRDRPDYNPTLFTSKVAAMISLSDSVLIESKSARDNQLKNVFYGNQAAIMEYSQSQDGDFMHGASGWRNQQAVESIARSPLV